MQGVSVTAICIRCLRESLPRTSPQKSASSSGCWLFCFRHQGIPPSENVDAQSQHLILTAQLSLCRHHRGVAHLRLFCCTAPRTEDPLYFFKEMQSLGLSLKIQLPLRRN